ncbi:MAG TPA: ORF6N domain-containing protein [Thermodesulfobacteriota bacterium]|nr:ORF6N domain-containing protein [Thermodesulfobacteriota bacterium]
MTKTSLIPIDRIERSILLLRGQKVMLDSDLAELYGVETRRLVEQVKRNIKRFPPDFMFQLTNQELINLRSQFATSSWGGRRYPPYAFTEQGVAMLSSVLNSEKAIEVNILIMRAFMKLREMIASNKDLAKKFEELEKKYDTQFKIVFDAIRQLMAPPEPKPKKIGFLHGEEK